MFDKRHPLYLFASLRVNHKPRLLGVVSLHARDRAVSHDDNLRLLKGNYHDYYYHEH